MRSTVLFFLCLTLTAQNTGPFFVLDGMWKGADYLELDTPSRPACSTGFFNGMTIAALVLAAGNSSREPKWLVDCAAGMSNDQIAEIIRKDIQDTPAEWHLPLNRLGLNAMVSACKPFVKTPARRR